jgi:preprotein translocase subunit SecD
MKDRNLYFLIAILVLAAVAIWIDLPSNPGIHIKIGSFSFDRDIIIHQGLDLQGGTQVLLEAQPAAGEVVTSEAMNNVKNIVENRVNGLGVSEPLVQLQGGNRIVVQLPGIRDPDQAIETIRGTGLLEFVDAGNNRLAEGEKIQTTYSGQGELPTPAPTLTETATSPLTTTVPATATTSAAITTTTTVTTSAEITATATLTSTGVLTTTAGATPAPPSAKVYTTIMTGKHLKKASVGTDEFGRPEIDFELTAEGAKIMADYSRVSVGKVLAILLDKTVISAPVIQTPITEGRGRITSQQGFPLAQARSIVVQLNYGALPVPLRVVENRSVGPTLGEDSVQRSIRAGLIGLIIVLLFMLIYYRLPGSIADVALLIYAAVNLALYKIIPVTLTLPGITGFLLSTGMAVDANILIFERMKEELRAGRTVRAAIEAGFDRAWTSIRDSNLSTLISCAVLYWFGSQFGASIVRGFAVTLFIGVVISMFTAITVSRTFLRFVFDLAGEKLREHRWLLGF